jgi:hypothetical protein
MMTIGTQFYTAVRLFVHMVLGQKDPRWFVEWFPATHIFRIAVFQYSGPWNEQNKNLLTGASRALEAGNAVAATILHLVDTGFFL